MDYFSHGSISPRYVVVIREHQVPQGFGAFVVYTPYHPPCQALKNPPKNKFD